MITITPRAVAVVAAVAVLATACGNSAEDGLEQLIEEQSGEDVDIDFDNGGISFESDEGTFTIDEEGNFIAVGPDGEVVTGDVDADGNSINIQSDDGDISIEGDGETGDVNISTDEGDVSFSSSQEIPDAWPSEIPEPTGLTVLAGTTFDDGTNSGVTVSGTTADSPQDYLAAYEPMLEAAGLTRTSFFENAGNLTAFYENADWVVTVSGAIIDDGSNISVGVSPATP